MKQCLMCKWLKPIANDVECKRLGIYPLTSGKDKVPKSPDCIFFEKK